MLKIHQILNNKPYKYIVIKHSLSQYITEDIAMHAGMPVAISEYLRLKNDTLNFTVPGETYLINVSRMVAGMEQSGPENAILILKAVISEFSQSWKAYDALGETYLMKADTVLAIQSFRKSLELNPHNKNSKETLKILENR